MIIPYEKPKVITIASNKGGVGRTRTSMTCANCLGSAGYRVCLIDLDYNNSATFFYLRQEQYEEAKKKNTCDAFVKESNDLSEYTLPTIRENVDIIASSRDLQVLRSMNEKQMRRMLPALNGRYDIIIFDCQPVYDNFTLNALNAADIIITPVLKDLDSFNAASFLQKRIAIDTEKMDCWYITINGYNHNHDEAKGGKQKEYVDEFTKAFPVTPKETWYPWTADMNEIKDKKMPLSRTAKSGCVYNPALYNAVVNLSECFVEEEHIYPGEVF